MTMESVAMPVMENGFGGAGLGAGFIGGLIFEIVFAAILGFIIYRNNKAVAAEYKLA